ncbi:MAG TPA: DUF397 domain-containing protein [Amycolatopsis sp.]|jgi:hypothetical protein|nr:DUF397 domain-containing protein [Amycolatopsis sp.]
MTSHELKWFKSSHSGGGTGDCVEVALTDKTTAVRDSKSPAAGRLAVPHPAWRAFLAELG